MSITSLKLNARKTVNELNNIKFDLVNSTQMNFKCY